MIAPPLRDSSMKVRRARPRGKLAAPATRAISAAAVALVKHFEGCYLKAYTDAVGVWTIGYGHTADEGDLVPGPGITITQAEAERLLVHDLQREAGNVQELLKAALNDEQFGALVSFTFNVGDGNLARSTLLNRVNNRRWLDAAHDEFVKWNHAGGRVLRGLTRRRISEANLFCSFPDPVISNDDLDELYATRARGAR